jgi:hypothetical protein
MTLSQQLDDPSFGLFLLAILIAGPIIVTWYQKTTK